MLTGDVFDISEGISIGFVDQVLPLEDADFSLQNTIQYLTSSNNLRAYIAITGASGDLNVVLVGMGNHLIIHSSSSNLLVSTAGIK